MPIGKENTPSVEAQYEAEGVVILLFNSEGKTFFIAEKEDNQKTLKKKGELGVVCETAKFGESWTDTAVRGLREELGLSMDDIMDNIRVEDNSQGPYLGKTPFKDGKCLAHVVALHVVDQRSFELKVKATEVDYDGWDWLDTVVNANPQSRLHTFISPFLKQEGFIDRVHHKHELVRFLYKTKDREGNNVWWMAKGLKKIKI